MHAKNSTSLDDLDQKFLDLQDGAALFVVTLQETPAVLNAKVEHKLREGDGCYALVPDRRKQNESGGRSFYIVSTPESLELAILSRC